MKVDYRKVVPRPESRRACRRWRQPEMLIDIKIFKAGQKANNACLRSGCGREYMQRGKMCYAGTMMSTRCTVPKQVPRLHEQCLSSTPSVRVPSLEHPTVCQCDYGR